MGFSTHGSPLLEASSPGTACPCAPPRVSPRRATVPGHTAPCSIAWAAPRSHPPASGVSASRLSRFQLDPAASFPSEHIFGFPLTTFLSSPPGTDSASGAGSPPGAATCGLRGAPRCHPGLGGSVCNEAELSAEIYGLAASGEAGATRTAELHVLRHLLPKPLRAPASLTALAPVQSLFKSPVQPPRAQILSPVDKLIDSSSDLIIFAHTFLFLGVCREGVSCYSFLCTL